MPLHCLLGGGGKDDDDDDDDDDGIKHEGKGNNTTSFPHFSSSRVLTTRISSTLT